MLIISYNHLNLHFFKVFIPFLLAILIMVSTHQPLLASETEVDFWRFERSQLTTQGLRSSSVGGLGMDKDKVGHMDLSYLESGTHGNAVLIDLGAGISKSIGATFFVGAGFVFGYNSELKKSVFSYYPETGIIALFQEQIGLVLSAKRFIGLYDGVRSENIISLGLLMRYEVK